QSHSYKIVTHGSSDGCHFSTVPTSTSCFTTRYTSSNLETLELNRQDHKTSSLWQ
ncbi:unnamed protein product, partial [Choristocarpus tenellus]